MQTEPSADFHFVYAIPTAAEVCLSRFFHGWNQFAHQARTRLGGRPLSSRLQGASRRALARRWAIGLMLLVLPLGATAASWEKLAPLPAPNGGFIGGEVQGTVIVLGGTNWEGDKKNWLNTVHRFDPAMLAWTTLESLPTPLAYGVGANLEGGLIVIGGSTGASPWGGVIRVFNGNVQAASNWGISSPAVLSAGGAIDGKIVVVGGSDDAANVRGLHREVRAWDINTGESRKLADFPGKGIGTAASATMAGELLVFAGATWDAMPPGVKNVADAWAFSLSRNEWRPLRPYPLGVRGLAAVVLDDRRIYLAGGYLADEFTDRAYVYDTEKDSYTPATALPYKGQVGLVRCGEFVYCIGGEDRLKHRSDAVHRLKVSELLR